MISIITVVWNASSTIERTIRSVIDQDYSDFEYVIIDGGSTDGTLDIIRKYRDRISTVISEPDKGIYDAMNKGIDYAKGDWIYFLGADDILYKNTVLSDLFCDLNCKEVDVLYGNVLFLNSGIVFDGEFDYEKMSNRSICHQAIFYKKEIFQKYGTFNNDYRINADYVFNVETFCNGETVWKFKDIIVAVYNESGISSAVKDKKLKKENFLIRYENFRPYVSKYRLSCIFYSSFFHFFISHPISMTFPHFIRIVKDVGFFYLLVSPFKILTEKTSRSY